MKFATLVCRLSGHRWTRTAAGDLIVWTCERCDEERLAGPADLVRDYHGAMPDLPPRRAA